MAAPVVTTGILTGGSNSHATTSEEVNAVATDFISEGVVGTFTNTSGVAPATGAFASNATATPDANINISTGVAYVTTTPTSQGSQALRIKCTVTGTLAIAANASGSTKYDWIYISVSATNAANPNTAADNVATIVASRSSSASTDDGTPPTYGYPIAVVTVANGFSTITNGNIRDVRTNCIVNLGSSSVSSGWTDLGLNPNTVTALGNRSYSLVFNSTDLTSTVSNGMRLKTTRLAPAPTQCTSLNGTNQYYSKTSPAGMTFTDDFVVSAWVKLSSYQAGTIASRYNGTSGWIFRVDAVGTVALVGLNAGAANFSQVTSYQAIPLNKWVHVSAQLDMSTFTATPTTSYVMFDGLDVPATVTRGGTNPTALIQAGDLQVGAQNGATVFLAGKIVQAAVYSAKVTQATILASIHQTLSGSETSLISAYSFNNTINDLSANANNLTANNAAVATNADSPFGGQANGTISATLDYVIVTKTAFSTNTTLTVQAPEGCTVPTSGGVSAVSYSTVKTPYGMNAAKDKWELVYTAGSSANATTSASFVNFSGAQLMVSIGSWNLVGTLTYAHTNQDGTLALSTNSTAATNGALGVRVFASAAATHLGAPSVQAPISLSTATQYFVIGKVAAGSLSLRGIGDDASAYATVRAGFDLL